MGVRSFHWSVVNPPGFPLPKETDSLSPRSNQLSIAPQLGGGGRELLPVPHYSVDCLDFVRSHRAVI